MSISPILERISLGKIVLIREQLMKAQASGQKVFRFESGDPSFAIPPHVQEAIARAAREGRTHYVPNDGIPQLREALWQKLRSRNGIPLPSPQDVFVTNGAMHALFVTFASLLDDGDEVLVPDPMWTEVVENILLAGGVPVGVPLRFEDGFEYDVAELERRVTPRTKAIFLNSPHNPTGAVLSRRTLQDILALAQARNLWIVSDEAYEDVLYPGSEHVSIASLEPSALPRIVSLFSFSKSYAMSGLRVGCIATCDEGLKARIPKLLRCTINGVNSLAQWGALAALQGPQDQLAEMREEYRLRRDFMLEALAGLDGVRVFAPRGGFCLWVELDPGLYPRLGVRDAEELSARLAEAGLGSAPGEAFGETCAHAIRFAFSCDTDMVREGAPLLRAFLEGPPPGIRAEAGRVRVGQAPIPALA